MLPCPYWDDESDFLNLFSFSISNFSDIFFIYKHDDLAVIALYIMKFDHRANPPEVALIILWSYTYGDASCFCGNALVRKRACE